MSGEPSLIIETFVGIFMKKKPSAVHVLFVIVNITAALKRSTQR